MSEIEKMDLESKDLVAERIEQLKVLFPEISVEGDGTIDFDKLRIILGDEVDEGQERYAFTWPGKADAIRQAQTPSTATLRPDEADSVDWDTTENLYIEGDNLEVLKLLQRGYHSTVDIVYIDPPYNTGGDFIYPDTFSETIDRYKEIIATTEHSNSETDGRFHSKWCSFIYPRLRLARELLSSYGVLFVSIGDDELDNLLRICDSVFGETNRIGIVSRQMKTGNNQGKHFAPNIDYVLAYAKDAEQCNPFFDTLSEELVEKVYNKVQKGGPRDGQKYRTMGLYQASLKHGGSRYPIVCPDGTKAITPEGRPWRWNEARLLKGIEDDEIVFVQSTSSPLINPDTGEQSSWNIYTKIWLEERLDAGQLPKNIITGMENRHGAKELVSLGIPFDFPKPTSLIKHLVKIYNRNDSLILDFFSGSSTTADAVMQLNAEDGGKRRVISIQLPESCKSNSEAVSQGYENLCEIGEERIRRAGQRIINQIEKDNKQLSFSGEPKAVPDIGFRVLKLDSSNFDQVEDGALVDNLIKPGRTDDDIIFEMMLKWGLELSLPMEKTEVTGYPITSIAADELICCMDEGLSVEVLEAIAALEPKRVFFLDSVLTDTIKLNAAQIFKRVGDKLGYEIELRTA